MKTTPAQCNSNYPAFHYFPSRSRELASEGSKNTKKQSRNPKLQKNFNKWLPEQSAMQSGIVIHHDRFVKGV